VRPGDGGQHPSPDERRRGGELPDHGGAVRLQEPAGRAGPDDGARPGRVREPLSGRRCGRPGCPGLGLVRATVGDRTGWYGLDRFLRRSRGNRDVDGPVRPEDTARQQEESRHHRACKDACQDLRP
jgi:hypothetical protein